MPNQDIINSSNKLIIPKPLTKEYKRIKQNKIQKIINVNKKHYCKYYNKHTKKHNSNLLWIKKTIN